METHTKVILFRRLCHSNGTDLAIFVGQLVLSAKEEAT